VLHDVDRVVRHRRVVERREVPERDDDVEDDEAARWLGDRPCYGVDLRVPEKRAKHPARRAHEKQRRHHERKHQVLHHVRAEQVRIAQVVERTVQGQENDQQARKECDLLASPQKGRLGAGEACAGAEMPGAPHVSAA
jgi:hypothetical protein